MLSSMLKEHRGKQEKFKASQEKLKLEAVAATSKFNNAVLSIINDGVSAAYVNQCQIDQEIKQLQTQSGRFNKLTHQWSTQLNKFHTALKELGDVENWASGIENDLKGVVDSLEYIHSNTESATNLNVSGSSS